MARPRSDERRTAVLDAAARVIASDGVGAPTALIAKAAGVSNGSLFTYFETKSELLNQLYVQLKTELAAATLDGLRDDAGAREQMLRAWTGWLGWAAAFPDKRRTLAHLAVSADITSESHAAVARSQAALADLLARCRDRGPMHDLPLPFVAALTNALAEATIDFVLRDHAHADAHIRAGFESLWRMISIPNEG